MNDYGELLWNAIRDGRFPVSLVDVEAKPLLEKVRADIEAMSETQAREAFWSEFWLWKLRIGDDVPDEALKARVPGFGSYKFGRDVEWETGIDAERAEVDANIAMLIRTEKAAVLKDETSSDGVRNVLLVSSHGERELAAVSRSDGRLLATVAIRKGSGQAAAQV